MPEVIFLFQFTTFSHKCVCRPKSLRPLSQFILLPSWLHSFLSFELMMWSRWAKQSIHTVRGIYDKALNKTVIRHITNLIGRAFYLTIPFSWKWSENHLVWSGSWNRTPWYVKMIKKAHAITMKTNVSKLPFNEPFFIYMKSDPTQMKLFDISWIIQFNSLIKLRIFIKRSLTALHSRRRDYTRRSCIL